MIKTEGNLLGGISGVAILIFVRDILGIGIPDVGVLGVSLIIMYKLPYIQLVYFLFFLFPLTCGIPGYIMFFGCLFLLNKSNRVTKRQILPVLIIFLIDLFDEGFTAEFDTYTGILSFISFCGIFFYFLNDEAIPKYNIPLAIRFFALGTVFTFFVIFYNMFQQYNIYYILAGFARSGALGVEGNDASIMRGHLAMNANTIAYYAICTISSVIVLFKNYNRKLAVIIISISTLCGILTLSRTFLLCLGLVGLCYIFMQNPKRQLQLVIAVCLIIVLAIFFYGDRLLFLSEGLIGRANDANMATAGGRTILFDEYNQVWLASLKYMIFGAGVVNYLPLLGCSNAMHCGLQQIWVCLGVSGFILFCQQIFTFISKYNSIKRLIYFLPFVVTFIFDQSIQFLNPYPLMLPIMISLLVCKEGLLTKIS